MVFLIERGLYSFYYYLDLYIRNASDQKLGIIGVLSAIKAEKETDIDKPSDSKDLELK